MNINDNTVKKWRAALKKKDVNAFNAPLAPKRKVLVLDDAEVAVPKTDPTVAVNDFVWNITFPKIAEDLIDDTVFKSNVITAVNIFVNGHLPIQVKVEDEVLMNIDRFFLSKELYSLYPAVNFKPVISGKKSKVETFMAPFREWTNYTMYWKGSFLKNKITDQITGIRLTGIAYNVPTEFSLGTPIAYSEKILI